eukprot:519383-Pelagomonas_calceolata.AAC.1
MAHTCPLAVVQGGNPCHSNCAATVQTQASSSGFLPCFKAPHHFATGGSAVTNFAALIETEKGRLASRLFQPALLSMPDLLSQSFSL